MTRRFTVGDEVVERVPHYALGTGVVVVGEVVGTAGPDYLVVGLRLPDPDPREPAAWDDPFLFDADELRRFRPRVDKAYRLGRLDVGVLRELDETS
ncbi:MAG TPA: hypothetical protein VNE21_07160 [Mycobacteriales bacterium]|nr:hypothetical protein [Mycobacteriales bacterium]